jgi:chloramphenicol 3-O-phosphotransferase
MDPSEKEVERALGPLISFQDQLRQEIETYERMRRGDLSALHDLRGIGRWLIGVRIAKEVVTERPDRCPRRVGPAGLQGRKQ